MDENGSSHLFSAAIFSKLKKLFIANSMYLLPICLIGGVMIVIITLMISLMIAKIAEENAGTEGMCITVTARGTIDGNEINATVTSNAGAEAKNLKDKIENNKFKLKTKESNKKEEDITIKRFDLTGIKRKYLDFYTWENWYINWAAGTGQRKMYNSKSYRSDACGVMKYINKDGTEDYMVALGSYFGTKIGTRYKISFSTGATITAVLADQKADQHTGKSVDTSGKHRYAKGGVLEFLVDKNKLNYGVKYHGNVAMCTVENYPIKPYITSITGINAKTEVNLDGTIDGKTIILEGSVDGNKVILTGNIENGEFVATGQYGTGCTGTGIMTWPVPSCKRITSDFGPRMAPCAGCSSFHQGIDISCSNINGKPVVAADSGKVTYATNMEGYGNVVFVTHSDKTQTRYAHLSQITVRKGDSVTKGQEVGRVGSTGNSTGPHLHFEVRIDGEAENPMEYVNNS